MGIFEPAAADGLSAAFARGIDPERAVAAMRWDVVNPWGRTMELMASHPLVARRIEALEKSGLPGAPRQWSVLRSLTAVSDDQRLQARTLFGRELVIAVAPWVILFLLVGFGAFTGSTLSVGFALTVAGAMLVYKQHLRYPPLYAPVDEVTSLLQRLDAGPVAGIGVEVKGEIIGRGFPGYVLSPDLVVQDASGFVPLQYRQPIPFVAAFFALFRADRFMGQRVVARGWYRRMPNPVIELRDVRAEGGAFARTWEWAARYAGSVLLAVVGVIVMLSGVGG
jgi:hypothetical protein